MIEVTIEIHYIASGKVLQSGSFPLRGKQPAQVALEFWKQIKKRNVIPRQVRNDNYEWQ